MSFDAKIGNYASKDTYLSNELDGKGTTFFGYGMIRSSATNGGYVDYEDLKKFDFKRENEDKKEEEIVTPVKTIKKELEIESTGVKSEITEETVKKVVKKKNETPSMRSINFVGRKTQKKIGMKKSKSEVRIKKREKRKKEFRKSMNDAVDVKEDESDTVFKKYFRGKEIDGNGVKNLSFFEHAKLIKSSQVRRSFLLGRCWRKKRLMWRRNCILIINRGC